MSTNPKNPDQPTDSASLDSTAGTGLPQTLDMLPSEAADKSEHVPPIIIKTGSFLIDFDYALVPPSGVFNPPYTYQYPFPFSLRGIRITGSPFGIPETLYYIPDPNDCRIELELRTPAGSLNLTLASLAVGPNRTLRLTTHDHALPPQVPTTDPDRPIRCQYAADDAVKLNAITVRDVANQILYRASGIRDCCIGIWRQHGH